jgi:DNA-binding GntR family transcriptional regulator
VPLELRAVEAVAGRVTALGAAIQAVEGFERLSPDASWRDVVDTDMRFHTALIAATGSARLQRMYGTLQAEIRLLRAQLRVETVTVLADEHRRLLATILAGPAGAAVQAMRDHLQQAERDLVALA